MSVDTAAADLVSLQSISHLPGGVTAAEELENLVNDYDREGERQDKQPVVERERNNRKDLSGKQVTQPQKYEKSGSSQSP